MTKPRKTKLERAIRMLNQGASTSTIVKALTVSPQYVYNVRSKMNKQADKPATITEKPEQLELNFGTTPLREEGQICTVATPKPDNFIVHVIKRTIKDALAVFK